MTSIQVNLAKILQQIEGKNVTLVAVTKTKPIEQLMQAYAVGFKRFGENYVQELVDKHEQMPKDIEWHLIGHLQTNKVKYIAPFVACIHSVDSLKLLKEINKQAEKNSRVVSCLLQVHIAEEDTKTGMSEEELDELLTSGVLNDLTNVNVEGLMGMSTFTEDMEQVKREFRQLKTIQTRLVASYPFLTTLSMGMSGDWALAIEEGSTMIRVGSAIFGTR